jgi:hypothetical protein
VGYSRNPGTNSRDHQMIVIGGSSSGTQSHLQKAIKLGRNLLHLAVDPRASYISRTGAHEIR